MHAGSAATTTNNNVKNQKRYLALSSRASPGRHGIGQRDQLKSAQHTRGEIGSTQNNFNRIAYNAHSLRSPGRVKQSGLKSSGRLSPSSQTGAAKNNAAPELAPPLPPLRPKKLHHHSYMVSWIRHFHPDLNLQRLVLVE